jgi:hypothetical protein
MLLNLVIFVDDNPKFPGGRKHLESMGDDASLGPRPKGKVKMMELILIPIVLMVAALLVMGPSVGITLFTFLWLKGWPF